MMMDTDKLQIYKYFGLKQVKNWKPDTTIQAGKYLKKNGVVKAVKYDLNWKLIIKYFSNLCRIIV